MLVTLSIIQPINLSQVLVAMLNLRLIMQGHIYWRLVEVLLRQQTTALALI